MKRFLILLSVLAFLLALSPAVLASDENIVDNAGLLTQAEKAELSQNAQALSKKYNIDIIIVTVDSLDGQSADDYAEEYYDNHNYGLGENRSGILLLLSMEYQDWCIFVNGDAHYAISYEQKGELFDSISWELSKNLYYDAFDAYLDNLGPYFQAYQESLAPPSAGDYAILVLISLAIGTVAGGIGLLILRSGMNTAKAQVGAQSYVVNNSFMLPVNQNTYLYSRTSRTRIQQSSGVSGGSRSGGGGSRSSRSGKF